MKKLKKFDWALIGILVVVLGTFIGYGIYNNKDHATKPKQLKPQKIEVTTTTIKEQKILIPTSYIGNAQEYTGVEIKPNTSGFLTNVNVSGGDYVKKGDILFEIDNRTYKAIVAEAKANVNKAKADLANATSYNNRIKSTSKGAVSQTTKDAANASYLEAKSAYNQALAQLKTAEINLGYTTLTAPNDGFLGDVSINVGDFVSEQTALAFLLKYSPIKIVFSIPQKDFGTKDISKDAIKLYNRNKKILPNKILRVFVDNKINQETSSVPIYLRVDNQNKNLLPGAYVNVILNQEIKKGIAIDKDKVVMMPQGNFVYTLKNNIITKTQVTIGAYLDYQYYISKGLKAGDLLITSPISQNQIGKKAEIKK